MANTRTRRGPLVIVGTGGSGTRVVAELARRAGYELGEHVNESDDALHIAAYLESAIDPYIRRTDWLRRVLADEPTDGDDAREFIGEFDAAVARHRAAMPNGAHRWGWKNPRCIFILPLVRAAFSDALVIHVVRDGRDMALSANQNQLRKHGHHLQMIGVDPDVSMPRRSVALWSWVNRAAATFGESRLGARYHRIRFEDLCAEPMLTCRRMCDFLGASGDVVGMVDAVRSPASLGRGRRNGTARGLADDPNIAEALAAFGYTLGSGGGAEA